MRKQTYQIEGMHCSSCVMLIDMQLEEIDGVNSTKTSYQKGQSEVEYDESKVQDPEIIAAIAKAGYKVVPLT